VKDATLPTTKGTIYEIAVSARSLLRNHEDRTPTHGYEANASLRWRPSPSAGGGMIAAEAKLPTLNERFKCALADIVRE
jgi:hypothetical protein